MTISPTVSRSIGWNSASSMRWMIDTPTVTGQVLGEGTGIRACFEALRPRWTGARAEAAEFNAKASGLSRRGVGVAGMWYGCGNTSLPNPSTVRVGLKPDGRIALHQGAVDIGQGSNTIVTQICADALGAPIERFDLVSGDTSITPDCGKTSASRQTFVTGKAAHMAGTELRLPSCVWPSRASARNSSSETGRITVKEDGSSASSACEPCHSTSMATLSPARPPSILPPARSMKMVRAFHTPYSDSARTWRRLRSIRN